MLEDFAPEIPGYALDMHTMKGKAMGRDLKHFRSEGAKLVPPPTADDPYENEASAMDDQTAQRSRTDRRRLLFTGSSGTGRTRTTAETIVPA